MALHGVMYGAMLDMGLEMCDYELGHSRVAQDDSGLERLPPIHICRTEYVLARHRLALPQVVEQGCVFRRGLEANLGLREGCVRPCCTEATWPVDLVGIWFEGNVAARETVATRLERDRRKR